MRIFAGPLVALAVVSACAVADDRPVAEKYMLSGELAAGEKALAEIVAQKPNDAQARFGLGTIQFESAIEHMMQGFYKYGLSPDIAGGQIPFLRMPVPANPKPEAIGYNDLRAIFERLLTDLGKAEATLAAVEDENVKMPIQLARVRLNPRGDGKASEHDTLWRLYAQVNRGVSLGQGAAERADGFDIAFDRGDVAWLRGYCHLLSALAEVYLAHDGQALFDHTAHLFFPKAKSPYSFLRHEPNGARQFGTAWISDVIALIHMMRLPVKEPKRAEAALLHMRTVIDLSRESWKYYLAETDNDREWIPNPKQTTIVPGGTITQEMVKGWMTFLDESEKILKGEVLIPFWRDAGGKGINVKRVFMEPRELDPVLWFQGTAAAPYLENGPVTSPEVWRRLQRVFQGEFIGFAFWIN